MGIGTVIKNLRMQKRMKQEELAEILGVSVQTVSRWENNINYPDIVMLPSIAALFLSPLVRQRIALPIFL